MSDPALCKFCGLDVLGPGDVCMGCEAAVEEGRAARRRMAPMEACPWLTAHHELVDVYGDPEYHDVHPLGTRGSCPWCSGWADAERELFSQVMTRGAHA